MSGYVKALEGFLRLFPKKIKVTLIDARTEKLIGVCKLSAEQFPLEFTKPFFLTTLDRKWHVLKTDPMRIDHFLITHRVILHVRDAEIVDPADTHFLMPTIAESFPETSERCLFDGFYIELPGDQWRQIEFLPVTAKTEIEDEISI